MALVSLLLVPFSPSNWHEALQGKLTVFLVCKIPPFQRNAILSNRLCKGLFLLCVGLLPCRAISSPPSSLCLSIKQYGFLKSPRLFLLPEEEIFHSPQTDISHYTYRPSKLPHPNRLPLYKLKIPLFTTSIHLFTLANLQGE